MTTETTKPHHIKKGIRRKLLIMMSCLLIALLMTLTVIQITIEKKILNEEMERRIELIRTNLADRGKMLAGHLAPQVENGIATFNFSNISELLTKIVKQNLELSYIILMDISRLAYVHTLKPELLQQILTNKEDIYAASREEQSINEYQSNNDSFIEFIMPIRVSTSAWGFLRLGFSLKKLNEEITKSKNENNIRLQTLIIRSLIILIIFILIGSMVSLLISARISKPLIRLTVSARKLAEGDFSVASDIKVVFDDEVGVLSAAFVEMTYKLKSSYEQIEEYSRTLEIKVEERTHELQDKNKELERILHELEKEIIERKRVENELQIAKRAADEANRAKTEFLASMSHEIRTPMNAILGMADLLWESELNEEQKQYVQIFRSAGENLLEIINDILDISKIEAGQVEIESVEFNLKEVVEKTCKILSLRAHEKGLEMNCSIALDVPYHLIGDPTRLRQILTNLMGNAIKFTKTGEVTLRVEKDVNSSKPCGLLFSVKDTGIGIPEDKLEAIFQSFVQVDSSITRKYGGTGLGLTISRKLVNLMGGKIWVESSPDIGTTFYFTVAFGIPSVRQKIAHFSTAELKGIKTLILDDNYTNRLILQELLVKWGTRVTTAENGLEGLEKLRTAIHSGDPYQLLILDNRMPKMGGFDVLEQFRKEFSNVNPTVVMMLTSDDRIGDRARGQKLGLAKYLVKPVGQCELLETILDAMKNTIYAKEDVESVTDITLEDIPSIKVLLAEDNASNRRIIQFYLKAPHISIDIAEDGKTAVEKYHSDYYDIILMDIQLPIMDGYAAIQAIRTIEKEELVPRTPILALTAHAFMEDKQKCLNAGCNAFLTKPIKKKILLNAIYDNIHQGVQSRTVGRGCVPDPSPAHFNAASAAADTTDKPPNEYPVRVNAELKDLIPFFMEDSQKELKTIRDALTHSDFVTISRLGHSIKGSSKNYGFELMADIGSALDIAGKQNNREEIETQIQLLNDYLNHVRIEYV